MLLRMVREPVPDGARLWALGCHGQNRQVLFPSLGGLLQLLSVKVAQSQVRSAVIGVLGENLFELVDSINQVTALFQYQSEIITGVQGFRLDGQGSFISR